MLCLRRGRRSGAEPDQIRKAEGKILKTSEAPAQGLQKAHEIYPQKIAEESTRSIFHKDTMKLRLEASKL